MTSTSLKLKRPRTKLNRQKIVVLNASQIHITVFSKIVNKADVKKSFSIIRIVLLIKRVAQ